MFCVLSYIVVFACDNEAFRFPKTTPRVVFTLGVRLGLNCQLIQWHNEIKDKPIFRVFKSPDRGKCQKLYKPLPYGRYQEWVKRLKE